MDPILRRLSFLSLVVTLSLLFSGQALAGAIQLSQTGQTVCYASTGAIIPCSGTGQDGALRMGVAWPNPRFTVSGDCVTDNLTGLMWAKNANLTNGQRTWQEALDFVIGLSLCGYSDWRLPNVNELESLGDRDRSNLALWMNTQGFTNVQSVYYWSSTSQASNPGRVWAVNMWAGDVGSNGKAHRNYIWPVRLGRGPETVILPGGQDQQDRSGQQEQRGIGHPPAGGRNDELIPQPRKGLGDYIE